METQRFRPARTGAAGRGRFLHHVDGTKLRSAETRCRPVGAVQPRPCPQHRMRRAPTAPAENPVLGVERIEEIVVAGDGIRGSQPQHAVRFERVVQVADDVPLQDRLEVHEQIPAAHEIDP